MNKDAIMATVIGFGIGLLITAAILFAPGAIGLISTIRLPKLTQTNNTIGVSPTPAQDNQSISGLTIESPLPDAIAPSDTIFVSGNAKPGSVVVLETPDGAVVSQANEQGKYAADVLLSEGKNDIVVTSYDTGVEESKTITIYYTQEDF